MCRELSYSDQETGSHFWYPSSSSGAERSNGGYNVRKKASWTTSGGFADFYVVQTTTSLAEQLLAEVEKASAGAPS